MALPSLEPNRNARYATIDYSAYKAEKMRKVRKVAESKWFPQKREKITEVGTDFYWTNVQKDIAVILEKNNKSEITNGLTRKLSMSLPMAQTSVLILQLLVVSQTFLRLNQ